MAEGDGMTMRFVQGDATAPASEGPKVIVHVCNDIGKWGKGFVLAISRRWKEPERVFKASFKALSPPVLGDVQFVSVEPSIIVANLIGQHGVATKASTTPPVRYDAIAEGLAKVAEHARINGASVHMPRIGCGLAGGDWSMIEPIIAGTLTKSGVDVTVYDFAAD